LASLRKQGSLCYEDSSKSSQQTVSRPVFGAIFFWKNNMEARISYRAIWFALKGRHQAVQEWNSDMVGNPAYVRFALRQRRVIWVL
jgi:hypothetical protein